ncbi:MAG: peptide ABC transporter substrate-binding protein, partial [Bacteroidetes bacterium]
KQLQNNLNINLEISVVSLAQKIERSQNGKLEFFRSGWIADFPSPENFLMLLYGKNVPETLDEPSYPNTSRYVNPEFDALFEKALSAATEEESNQFFMEAEKLAMADAPMIILWYEESYRLLQPYVQGAENNPMQFRDYSVTYFKK